MRRTLPVLATNATRMALTPCAQQELTRSVFGCRWRQKPHGQRWRDELDNACCWRRVRHGWRCVRHSRLRQVRWTSRPRCVACPLVLDEDVMARCSRVASNLASEDRVLSISVPAQLGIMIGIDDDRFSSRAAAELSNQLVWRGVRHGWLWRDVPDDWGRRVHGLCWRHERHCNCWRDALNG